MKKRAFLAATLLLVAGSVSRAGLITVTTTSLSNPGNQGYISYSNGTQSGSGNVYISQFHATVAKDGGSTNFLTYCVDLFHHEQFNTPYNVTAATLSSVFGPNAGQIAYLYKTYGTADLSGNSTRDAALQLALWDLSLGKFVNPNNPFTGGTGPGSTYFNIGTIKFGTTDITSAVSTEVKRMLDESKDKTASGVGVYVSDGTPGGYQQSVLYLDNGLGAPPVSLPEPAGIMAALSGLPCVGGVLAMARRRLRAAPAG